MAYVDLTGARFGPFTVLCRAETYGSPKDKAAKWECLCDCGGKTVRSSHQLSRSKKPPTACGRTCPYHGKNKHGLCETKEYAAWNSMNQRCRNPKHARYVDYGGRGISVHPRWVADFSAFLTDVGAAPAKNFSLDRIDNDGNYEPGNVRWLPNGEQQRNQRRTTKTTHLGKEVSLSELSEITGVKQKTLYSRAYREAKKGTK